MSNPLPETIELVSWNSSEEQREVVEGNEGKETSTVISEEVKEGTVITLSVKEILPTYFGHSRSYLDITLNTAQGRRTLSI